jgi:hypothetical protein
MLVMVVDLKPSGGRGAFAKVKDPSGAMGAAVHQTLLEREPALTPGAALLLAGAPVFSPVPGLTYLTLVPQNVAKVGAWVNAVVWGFELGRCVSPGWAGSGRGGRGVPVRKSQLTHQTLHPPMTGRCSLHLGLVQRPF